MYWLFSSADRGTALPLGVRRRGCLNVVIRSKTRKNESFGMYLLALNYASIMLFRDFGVEIGNIHLHVVRLYV